jgi:hypothetical protein
MEENLHSSHMDNMVDRNRQADDDGRVPAVPVPVTMRRGADAMSDRHAMRADRSSRLRRSAVRAHARERTDG